MRCGMCMTITLFDNNAQAHAACGYEDGTLAVWSASAAQAPLMYARLQTEPIMALAMDSSHEGALLEFWSVKYVVSVVLWCISQDSLGSILLFLLHFGFASWMQSCMAGRHLERVSAQILASERAKHAGQSA